jgi:hypothetical protein
VQVVSAVVPMPTMLPPPLTFDIVDEKLLLQLLPLEFEYGGGAGVMARFAVFNGPISEECCFKYGFPYVAEYRGSTFKRDWSKKKNTKLKNVQTYISRNTNLLVHLKVLMMCYSMKCYSLVCQVVDSSLNYRYHL